MFKTRYLVIFAALMFYSSFSHALEKRPFEQSLFESLQAKGEVVLVDVYAAWCPACAKQQAALQDYIDTNPDKEFHILEVSYDDDKDIVRQFRAPRQSTLLLYKGEAQFWFSVAETRPEVIAAELDKAINFKKK